MENLVRAICHKEGIDCRSVRALSGGQVNRVFSVDERYVVRIGFREDAYPRLKRETGLMQALEGRMPIPRIYAFGQHDGRVYQIQQFIPGQKLYTVWKDLAPGDQENIAADMAAALKVMHSQAAPSFGYDRDGSPACDSWPDFLLDKFAQTLDELKMLKIRMAPGFVELAAAYIDKHRGVLDGGAPVRIHGDLTLVNILANEGRVSAVLDFEYGMNAPADYELWAIEAFCLYPNDWAEEDNEVFCTADFASYIPLLRRYHPALFATPHLRERMNLYHIDAALSSYLSWRKDNLGSIPPEQMASSHFYMARISNFIFDHGVRMFFG